MSRFLVDGLGPGGFVMIMMLLIKGGRGLMGFGGFACAFFVFVFISRVNWFGFWG